MATTSNTHLFFDHNSTTPLHPNVEKILHKKANCFGNPSSIHSLGQIARDELESSRYSLADFLSVSPTELIFTSSGTEANNQILMSIWHQCVIKKEPCHIITSTIEHACVANVCQFIEKLGGRVSYIPVDKTGIVDLAALEAAITPDTKLISVMYANNEFGTIQPMEDLVSIAQKHKIFLHSDAVQALGKLPLNLSELPIDFVSFSGHKLSGPKGIGALYIKQGIDILPFIYGGSQERSLRAGTENMLGIVGFGEAVRCLVQDNPSQNERITTLTAQLMDGLLAIPESYLNGHPTQRLSNTFNLSFTGITAQSLMIALDQKGIALSTGSACSSGSTDPSPMLKALGLDDDRLESAIRFSLGRTNTQSDIDRALDIIPETVAHLRKVGS